MLCQRIGQIGFDDVCCCCCFMFSFHRFFKLQEVGRNKGLYVVIIENLRRRLIYTIFCDTPTVFKTQCKLHYFSYTVCCKFRRQSKYFV
jgi:hypothetical protein